MIPENERVRPDEREKRKASTKRPMVASRYLLICVAANLRSVKSSRMMEIVEWIDLTTLGSSPLRVRTRLR